MDHNDRDLILGLANRLRQAPPAPQDPQAAELIAQQIASHPNAIYLLVQAVLLQDDALRQAQARIAAMGTAPQAAAPNPAFALQPGYAHNPTFAPQPGYAANPGYSANPAFAQPTGYGQQPSYGQHPGYNQQPGYEHNPAYGQQGRPGGSFMKTAAVAAAGVAGGALLVAGANELFSDDEDQTHQAQGGGEEDGFSMTDLF